MISRNKSTHAQKKDAYQSHCPAAGWGCPPPLSWWSPPLCSGSSWTAERRQYRCTKHTTQSIQYPACIYSISIQMYFFFLRVVEKLKCAANIHPHFDAYSMPSSSYLVRNTGGDTCRWRARVRAILRIPPMAKRKHSSKIFMNNHHWNWCFRTRKTSSFTCCGAPWWSRD